MKKFIFVLISIGILGFHSKHYKVCMFASGKVICSSTNFTKKDASVAGQIASEISQAQPDIIWVQDINKPNTNDGLPSGHPTVPQSNPNEEKI